MLWGPKKISSNGQTALNYWVGKTRFWDIDINLVDWATIERVVSGR